jgi:hypothetical protein
MPDQLRQRRDDWHGIRSFAEDGSYQDGKWIAGVYGERAADEIHREKEVKSTFWQPGLTSHPWSVAARARLEEILATFNAWEAACEEAQRPLEEAIAAPGASVTAAAASERRKARRPSGPPWRRSPLMSAPPRAG